MKPFLFKIFPTLLIFTSVSASVRLSSSDPLVMDLNRNYLIDANTVLEFKPPTVKVGLEITNSSSSNELFIDRMEVTMNYTHQNEVLQHKTSLSPKNIININSDHTYIDTYTAPGSSILKLEPKKTIRLGGDQGWVILENLIPKEELGYGGYMDVSFQESEITFVGYYLNKSDGKQIPYEEKVKFSPIKL